MRCAKPTAGADADPGLQLPDKGRSITRRELLQAVLSPGLLVRQELLQMVGQRHYARRRIAQDGQPFSKAPLQ